MGVEAGKAPTARAFFAETARLPEGWASHVRLEVDAAGILVAVIPGAEADGAERLAGPVVPGIGNLHSHAFQRAMAGLAERGAERGDSFWAWRRAMYDFVARLTPEDVLAIAAQLYVEMLKGGYVAVGEFHFLHNDTDGRPFRHAATMAEAVMLAGQEAGIAQTILPTVHLTGGMDNKPLTGAQRRFAATPGAVLDMLETLAPQLGPEQRTGVAFQGLRAVNARAIRETLVGLDAKDADAPIHIHIAEQAAEVEESLEHLGATPVEWLLGEAPVGPRWCLIHATHMTEVEARRLGATGAVVGLCPTTEANLGDGLFRFELFRRVQGRFGVGSDSHVSVCPREELRWLHYGQRLVSGRRALAPPGRCNNLGASLRMLAGDGGGRGLGRRTGRLAPGCKADFLVLDADNPTLCGRAGDLLLDSLVFSHQCDQPIRDVFVAGIRRVADGHHPREAEIAARYRTAVRRLLAA